MTFEKRILADGRATLYRGDSLELLRAGVFGKLGAIVSDPPYGIRLQESRGGSGSTDSPVSNGGRGLKRLWRKCGTQPSGRIRPSAMAGVD